MDDESTPTQFHMEASDGFRTLIAEVTHVSEKYALDFFYECFPDFDRRHKVQVINLTSPPAFLSKPKLEKLRVEFAEGASYEEDIEEDDDF